MPLRNSPIRTDKVKEALDFIASKDLENATANQKMYFLFRKKLDITLGLSIMEIALVIFPDEKETVTITDKNTGQVSEITRPTREAWQKTHQQIKVFREYAWEKGGIIFFCGTDPKTGAQYYYNMTKEEFLKLVMDQLMKIYRGAKRSKNRIHKWIKLSPELKKQLARNGERSVHQEIMESEMRKTKKKKRKQQIGEEIQSHVQ